MKATLYLPYAIADPEKGFNYDDPSFTDRKYIQILTKDYVDTKDTVNMMISNNFDRRRNGFFGGISFNGNKIKRSYIQQKYQYNQCKCIVKDIHNNDEKIGNLIRYYRSKEQFVIILKLINMSSNPDLETEMKMWLRESNHINFSKILTEDEKIFNLPKKDFKIEFDDTKNSAVFSECKIIEGYNSSEYAVLVKKIAFL